MPSLRSEVGTQSRLETCPSMKRSPRHQRGRHSEVTVDSGAGESVLNPPDWPNVGLRPSMCSVKGQRYVGPGSGKNDNSGQLTLKVCTRQYGGGDISGRMTFQGAKARTPLLVVSEVIDKANMVVFDGTDWFLHIARYMNWRQLCEKGRCRCPGAPPTPCEKWSVRSYTGLFQSAGSASKGPSTRPSKPGPPFLWRTQG